MIFRGAKHVSRDFDEGKGAKLHDYPGAQTMTAEPSIGQYPKCGVVKELGYLCGEVLEMEAEEW